MMLLLAFEVLKLTYGMPAIQPSLRDLGHSKLAPALKRRAIFTMSLRDKALAEFPKHIRPPDWLLICHTAFGSGATHFFRSLRLGPDHLSLTRMGPKPVNIEHSTLNAEHRTSKNP